MCKSLRNLVRSGVPRDTTCVVLFPECFPSEAILLEE